MKSTVRRLARVRHAVCAVILQGAAAIIIGLVQSNTALMLGGIVTVLLATALLAATHVVTPVLEGEIVVSQQPQLPDAHAHMHALPELPQAA